MKKSPNQKTINKLYRDSSNAVLAGIASGIADYFEIDATIIRILFVLLFVFGGSGLIIYLILWIIIPKQKDNNKTTEEIVKNNTNEIKEKAKSMAEEIRSSVREHESEIKDCKGKQWLGLVILGLGVMFLLRNMGLLRLGDFGPMILIVLGLMILFK